MRGEGRFDGVFGLWYGKGPGVDRSGDVFRHANLAGTSRHGGVLALMGDDTTAESSTTAHQSEFAFVDAMMPILSPAGVQEILDYGALGWALEPLRRRLGRPQMRQGHGRIDGRGRRLRSIASRRSTPDRFRAAARRPRHPPRRRRAGAGRAPARAQAARGRRLARRQPAQPPHHVRRRRRQDRHHHRRQILSRRAPGARRARPRRGALRRARPAHSSSSAASGRSSRRAAGLRRRARSRSSSSRRSAR